MRNRILATLALGGLLVAAPLVAQESCALEIDVMETLLVQLQVAAEAGDADGALTLRDELREQLLLVEDGCVGAEAAAVTLDGYFEAPDNRYTVNYPEDWLFGEYEEAAYPGDLSILFFANNAEALEVLGTESTPEFSAGQQGFALLIGGPQALAGDAEEIVDFESYMNTFVNSLRLEDEIIEFTDVTYFSIQDQRAGQIDIYTDTFAAAVTLIEFEPRLLYGAVIGVAVPDELAELRPTLDAIAETWTVK